MLSLSQPEIQAGMPDFFRNLPDWLINDMPGQGHLVKDLSRGNDTWTAGTRGASDMGWIVYENLTINGLVKWSFPVLRLIVLDTLIIGASGELNGGAADGGDATSSLSGAGGDSILPSAAGGAGKGTSLCAAGNAGTYGSGGGGATALYSGTCSGVAGGGSTDAEESRISQINADTLTSNIKLYHARSIALDEFSTQIFRGYLKESYFLLSGGDGGNAASPTSACNAAGGGGGAGSANLIVVAATIINSGAIKLEGGAGGAGYIANGVDGNDYGQGGDGGNGGDLWVFSESAANGTRSTSGGAAGSGEDGNGSAYDGAAGSAGRNEWLQL